MLFRKDLPRSCSYCVWGTKIDDTQVLCVKRGIVSDGSSCRKYAYDPCKRCPPKPKEPDFDQYKDSDFSL